MSDVQKLLEEYTQAVRFPEVSGFEVLELLDVRSRLAERESELDEEERGRLKGADRLFRTNAERFRKSLANVGDIRELRRRAGVPASHRWWHLEKLVQCDTAIEAFPMQRKMPTWAMVILVILVVIVLLVSVLFPILRPSSKPAIPEEMGIPQPIISEHEEFS
jgi:hypothetical protein